MMKKWFTLLILTSLLSSCEILEQLGSTIDTVGSTTTTKTPLSEIEVVSGLKEALRVSTDSAVGKVSLTNGFFKDAALKILLPPEADIITKNLDNPVLKTLGISKMVDDVVLRLNRSAEEASKKAGPIFINAIKGMSISDAFGILKGGDTAATHFFRQNTYQNLYSEFKPIVNQFLDKQIVGNISTNQAWTNLTSAYNKVAQFSSSLTPVNTKLDDYVTKKTIHGVFVKLAEEEKDIRKDPVARVSDILKRVFGY